MGKFDGELGENALFLKHDVTSEVEWSSVVEETESKLVLFLAEDASYSIGSEFVIDGGLTAKY